MRFSSSGAKRSTQRYMVVWSTTRCHSVRSRGSPDWRSFQRSLVATERCTIFWLLLRVAHLGVAAEIAHQDHLVDAAGHLLPAFSWRGITTWPCLSFILVH